MSEHRQLLAHESFNAVQRLCLRALCAKLCDAIPATFSYFFVWSLCSCRVIVCEMTSSAEERLFYSCIELSGCVCVPLSISVCQTPAGTRCALPRTPSRTRLGLLFVRGGAVPGDEAALSHVPPDVSGAVSMLSRVLPGDVVVADVTISPLTIIQAARAIAWTQHPKHQEGHDAAQPHPQPQRPPRRNSNVSLVT